MPPKGQTTLSPTRLARGIQTYAQLHPPGECICKNCANPRSSSFNPRNFSLFPIPPESLPSPTSNADKTSAPPSIPLPEIGRVRSRESLLSPFLSSSEAYLVEIGDDGGGGGGGSEAGNNVDGGVRKRPDVWKCTICESWNDGDECWGGYVGGGEDGKKCPGWWEVVGETVKNEQQSDLQRGWPLVRDYGRGRGEVRHGDGRRWRSVGPEVGETRSEGAEEEDEGEGGGVGEGDEGGEGKKEGKKEKGKRMTWWAVMRSKRVRRRRRESAGEWVKKGE